MPDKKGRCLTLPNLVVNYLIRVLGGTRFRTFVLIILIKVSPYFSGNLETNNTEYCLDDISFPPYFDLSVHSHSVLTHAVQYDVIQLLCVVIRMNPEIRTAPETRQGHSYTLPVFYVN